MSFHLEFKLIFSLNDLHKLHKFFITPHKEWDEFFPSSINYTPFTNKTEYFNQNVYNSYYISFCLFICLNETGAVRITYSTSDKLKFLIETSLFDSCEHKSDEGGSLYVNSNNCECVQNRICSYGSKSTNGGAYCCIMVSSSPAFKNYLINSTITLSGYETKNGRSNVYMEYGKINMKSINISYSKVRNKNYYYASCTSNSSITHSTFSNNTSTSDSEYNSEASHQGSEASPSNQFEFKIDYCNYIKNECYYLIFGYDVNIYINNCSFNKNGIKKIYFSPYTHNEMQIKGCYFDIQDPAAQRPAAIIERVDSIYPTNQHLSSGLCLVNEKLNNEETVEGFNRNNKFRKLVYAVSLVPK